jgi:predicted nuclease of predicted toxin-antitoxin system
MRFFLDENFPKAAEALLAQKGHETIDIRGTEKEGSDDDHLFLLAQNSQAVFLTTDKDFFHTVPHLYPVHAGVVVVALRQPNRRSILAKLSWLLDHITPDQFATRVFLLLDDNWVVYPPLD